MPNWKKVIVSGSDAVLASVTATLGFTGSLSGSLNGTASYSTQALSSSYALTASYVANASSFPFTGSAVITGSLTLTGSFNQLGDYNHTGNVYQSGSKFLNGTFSQTGSLSITGSTTQIGNNTLAGNTTLSGSIIISGSTTTPSSPSIKVYGDIETDGTIKFLPVNKNIDTTLSGSYIYVSGSTNDLYFSQNGNGYSNITRLRWLEGNLYTGLLNGGLVTTLSSTVYQVASGSGIIVNLNGSINANPYPTITYVNWGNVSASIAPLSSSYDQSFVAIDSTGSIYVQGAPLTDGQLDSYISVGVVLHQNRSTINGVATQPELAYGWKQRNDVFVNAFGPLKLSGHIITPSSSLGLSVSSGTSFLDGGNYQNDPNNPSYVTDSGATGTPRIFRYRQSGSSWVYDTNAGAGYTTIDSSNYSNNGTLTNVGAGDWSIQRVFFFPTSPLSPKPIVVYYGNTIYPTEADALSNLSFETFVEAPNTAANAIYLGAIVIRGGQNFTNTNNYAIYPGGLFRQVGGSGGGGSVITQTLSGLSDVSITSPTNGQPLVYNSSSLKWQNNSNITATASYATIALTSSYALNTTSASYATTSSYVLNAVSASYALTASYASQALSSSYASTASYVVNAISASFASTASYVVSSSYALTASYVITAQTSSYNLSSSYAISSSRATTSSYALTTTSASYALTATTSSYALTSSYVNPLNQTLTVTGSVVVSGSSGTTIFNANADTLIFSGSATITGSLTLTGSLTATSFTGSLLGTSSYASQALSSSYANNSTSASYALSSSYSLTSTSASYALSSSYALTSTSASYAPTAPTFPYTGSAIITGSLNVVGPIIIKGAAKTVYNTDTINAGASNYATTISETLGTYRGIFIKYIVDDNGGNLRAGEIKAIFDGSSVRFTEATTTDIGNTSALSFTMVNNGSSIYLAGSNTGGSNYSLRAEYTIL